jgi:hypothetical protein
MTDKLQDVLNQIEQLQKTEEQLYKALTKNAENVALGKENTFTDSEIETITNQVNSLTTSRVNLYNYISNSYRTEMQHESTATSNMKQQAETLKLLEKELNKSKNNLSKLEDEKYNQLKMIEINTYFSKQYDAHKRLMRLVTIVGICMLVTLLLGYIEPLKGVSNLLFNIVTFIGVILIIKKLVDMYLRRDDNYDEYLWPVAPNTDTELATANAESNSFIDISGVDIGNICFGSSCCSEGTVWDDVTSMCIIKPI